MSSFRWLGAEVDGEVNWLIEAGHRQSPTQELGVGSCGLGFVLQGLACAFLSIFLLKPASEDVGCVGAAVVTGGCDRMGASGMGNGEWGTVRVTLGRGSGGVGPGRWSCGRNGCSPG